MENLSHVCSFCKRSFEYDEEYDRLLEWHESVKRKANELIIAFNEEFEAGNLPIIPFREKTKSFRLRAKPKKAKDFEERGPFFCKDEEYIDDGTLNRFPIYTFEDHGSIPIHACMSHYFSWFMHDDCKYARGVAKELGFEDFPDDDDLETIIAWRKSRAR